MILYMYIAPGQGQKTSWGQTFDVNRKPLSLRPFVASLWILILFIFFNVFPHVYSPRAGPDNQPSVDKILMSTEKPCHFAHLLQVSKKYLWSLILYIIFHDFIHVYNRKPLGVRFF